MRAIDSCASRARFFPSALSWCDSSKSRIMHSTCSGCFKSWPVTAIKFARDRFSRDTAASAAAIFFVAVEGLILRSRTSSNSRSCNELSHGARASRFTIILRSLPRGDEDRAIDQESAAPASVSKTALERKKEFLPWRDCVRADRESDLPRSADACLCGVAPTRCQPNAGHVISLRIRRNTSCEMYPRSDRNEITSISLTLLACI